MINIILFVLGFIGGFIFACGGMVLMTLGTIIFDKNKTLYIEMDNEEASHKIVDGRKYVIFRIKRR